MGTRPHDQAQRDATILRRLFDAFTNEIFKFIARTKQTVRKSTGGKPPDPRLGQWFKDMCKAGETSLNNVMDRGDKSPTAASSEAEEVHDQDMDQDVDPNANPGHEDEAASEDDDGLEPSDMQHMVIHSHRTKHSGAWCIKWIDADEVFEWLTKFEKERRSGKRKTNTPRTSNNKKKPRFKPINGLSDEDLKLAWTVLEEGKVWVSKPAKYQGPEDVVSLRDFCKILKATRDLEKRIVKYWNTRDLTVSTEFTIVSVMDYGQQLVDFTSAIKEMKDARVIFECGCYEAERPDRKMELSRPTWQLVYAFVSLGTEDYKPCLVENSDYRPHSCELRYKTWQEELTLDKGVGSEAVNLKNKAPRWEFVVLEPGCTNGLEPSAGFTSGVIPWPLYSLFSNKHMSCKLPAN
ncbi:hypothetical protein R1sor_007833 [Riccia sorocarpa]|uniref:Uncharacterized protein n=1 Tax=Riccia sorocarpa TaxID=122646 RepID=A0ABD3HV35_9MARC